MARLNEEQKRDLFHHLSAFLLLGFGFYRVLSSSFSHPAGGFIDGVLLLQVAIGCCYVFSGIWIILWRPPFTHLGVLGFIVFSVEISQAGRY